TNELLSYNKLLNEKMEKLSLELSNVPPSEVSSEDGGEWPEAYNTIMNNCFNQAKELELLQSQLEKSKEDFRMLLNVKDEIERSLGEKEREYLEQIRQCEAVTTGQAGMIDSMEILLKDLEGKMDKLINEKIQQQQAAANEKKKKTHRKQNSSISSMKSLRHQNSNSELSHSKKQLQPQPQLSNVSGRMTPSRHGHRPSISSISIASVVAEREQVRPVSPAPSKESLLSNQPSSDFKPLHCLSPPHSRPKPVTNPATLLTDEVRIQYQNRFSLAKRWVEDDDVTTCQHESCNIRFNLWRRRHHCRRCGNIFCSTHSDYSMLLFPDGTEDWGGVWSRLRRVTGTQVTIIPSSLDPFDPFGESITRVCIHIRAHIGNFTFAHAGHDEVACGGVRPYLRSGIVIVVLASSKHDALIDIKLREMKIYTASIVFNTCATIPFPTPFCCALRAPILTINLYALFYASHASR
ncbi:2532_t:CDS:2, partial [Acaulospora morrowiae]